MGWLGPQELLAQLALWVGRCADALRQAVDALDALDADGAALELRDRRWLCLRGLWAAADLAEEARARQDEAGAAQAVNTADELGARFAAHVRASPARATSHDPHLVVDTLLADAEVRRAHGRSDPELWARVAEHWERLDHVPDAAVARWREAEALVHGRSRSAAAEPLRAAAATARRICARPLLERIESLARRARIELPGDDVAAANAALLPANLTPREREVLGLLAEGLGNAEIGRRLFISDKTASVHVANIKGKLGVTSRIGAATIAVRHGLGDAHRSTAPDRSAGSRDA
jgi:DNA-binding CsgD family transcriptional regulator